MEKTEEWQKEVISLEHCLPSPNQVLQACLRAIANLQKYLPILLKLGSHFLKLSCWKEIFAGETLVLRHEAGSTLAPAGPCLLLLSFHGGSSGGQEASRQGGGEEASSAEPISSAAPPLSQ